MAQELHTRKLGNSVAMWAIFILIAAIVFFGIWEFLSSEGHNSTRQKVGTITHSTPVGGELLDGVFHPQPEIVVQNSDRWHI